LNNKGYSTLPHIISAPAVLSLQRRTTAYALGIKNPSDTKLFMPPRVASAILWQGGKVESERKFL